MTDPPNLQDIIDQITELCRLRAADLTDDKLKKVAARGALQPQQLDYGEIRDLCQSVLAHIARHGPLKN